MACVLHLCWCILQLEPDLSHESNLSQGSSLTPVLQARNESVRTNSKKLKCLVYFKIIEVSSHILKKIQPILICFMMITLKLLPKL